MIKKNGNGKLVWDSAEAIKLFLIILSIVITGVTIHYETAAKVERAVIVNSAEIKHNTAAIQVNCHNIEYVRQKLLEKGD